MKSSSTSGSFTTLPEAYVLRQIQWQYFVTLTFRSDRLSERSRVYLLFAWLRDVAATDPKIHFKGLLWVARFERGRGSRGHYHVLLAGKPARAVTPAVCGDFEAAWRTRAGAIAQVTPYDHARDGVGYTLKVSPLKDTEHGAILTNDDDETYPMISNSLLKTIRQGCM